MIQVVDITGEDKEPCAGVKAAATKLRKAHTEYEYVRSGKHVHPIFDLWNGGPQQMISNYALIILDP